MSNIKEAIERLSKYPQDAPTCIVIWLSDDVVTRAKERYLEVSKELAAEILESLENHHDANDGITWDHIDAELDNYRNHEGLTQLQGGHHE